MTSFRWNCLLSWPQLNLNGEQATTRWSNILYYYFPDKWFNQSVIQIFRNQVQFPLDYEANPRVELSSEPDNEAAAS